MIKVTVWNEYVHELESREVFRIPNYEGTEVTPIRELNEQQTEVYEDLKEMLEEGKASVRVLRSSDRWYGVTYAADKPGVVAALRQMAADGKYPDGLWNK